MDKLPFRICTLHTLSAIKCCIRIIICLVIMNKSNHETSEFFDNMAGDYSLCW